MLDKLCLLICDKTRTRTSVVLRQKKKKARFPLFTEKVRRQFDPLSMKTAVDLPCTQTLKDGVKQECDAGFHQPLEEECGEHFPPNGDKYTRAHKKGFLSLHNARLAGL